MNGIVISTFYNFHFRIHSFGNKRLAENHPDSRAVMYESATYSKRKILDLISTIEAFEAGQSISAIFERT